LILAEEPPAYGYKAGKISLKAQTVAVHRCV
jgi:hypothetical protein